MLGLPWGVLAGLMKLFLVGVSGRDAALLSLVPPGNKLAMKPDIVDDVVKQTDSGGGLRERCGRGAKRSDQTYQPICLEG